VALWKGEESQFVIPWGNEKEQALLSESLQTALGAISSKRGINAKMAEHGHATASIEPSIVAYIRTWGQISYENLPGCGKRGRGDKKAPSMSWALRFQKEQISFY